MNIKYFLPFILIVSNLSCKKYLDEKSSISLTVPTKTSELQGLLENSSQMNGNYISLGDLGSDTYWLTFPVFQSAIPIVQTSYVWQKDTFQGQTSFDWNQAYAVVYTANVVINGLSLIEVNSNNLTEWNATKGNALFYRSYIHYMLEETFGQPYRPSTAATDLGIPVKLTSDLFAKSFRSTVQETFNQIIKDLNQAGSLVPVAVDLEHRNHISKPAVFAMLARVYLTMQNYSKAKLYADSTLQLYNNLVDFNTLNQTVPKPFPGSPNEINEIIFMATQGASGIVSSRAVNIDSNLYKSYDSNDLRKTLFFAISPSTKYPYYKGQYANGANAFEGLAIDEIYLIRAECYARKGDVISAMDDLNNLLVKRWAKGKFNKYTAVSADDALSQILIERRKELIYRGMRWPDLRRLNQDNRFAITLERELNGVKYTLLPNDPKYTYPIPPDELQLSGIEQNKR